MERVEQALVAGAPATIFGYYFFLSLLTVEVER